MITRTLATTTLTSATASITFNNLSTSYKDLIVITSSKADSTSTAQFISMQFNGNTGNNYANVYLYGGNATTSPVYSSFGALRDYLALSITRSPYEVQDFNTAITHVFDYQATDKWKSVLSETNDTGQNYYGITAGIFQSTSAVTSVTIKHDTGNLGAGTKITLMGVSA